MTRIFVALLLSVLLQAGTGVPLDRLGRAERSAVEANKVNVPPDGSDHSKPSHDGDSDHSKSSHDAENEAARRAAVDHQGEASAKQESAAAHVHPTAEATARAQADKEADAASRKAGLRNISVTGRAVSATGDTCSVYTDCASCSLVYPCGWCPSKRQCLTGSASGPDANAGYCDGPGTWAWLSTQCDACNVYTSCSTCTPVDSCGWCPSSKSCSTGNSVAPSGGGCGSPGVWTWLPSACDACNNYDSSCTTCTAQSACGWCPSVRGCFTGSYTGPNQGSCYSNPGTWAWFSSSCDPCNNVNYTCQQCTALATCGWCQSNAACYAGSSLGPTGAQCEQQGHGYFGKWDWISSSCGSNPTAILY